MSIYKFASDITASLSTGRNLVPFLITVVIISIFTIGCSSNSMDTVQPEPYFPTYKEPQTIFLLLMLQGELTADEGYLRVNDRLIIWPYGYSLDTENGEIRIINEESQPVAKVGDTIRLGGGGASASFVEEKIGQLLPEGCEGPYWLGWNIRKID